MARRLGSAVTGQVVATNPAHAVRGPKHVVETGKTTMLDAEQTRKLLDSIDIWIVVGLRDRALISVMTLPEFVQRHRAASVFCSLVRGQ